MPIFNQGNGRSTRGGRGRRNARQLHETAEWVQGYRQWKAENRRRFTVTDAGTGETKSVTKSEFETHIRAALSVTPGFQWTEAVKTRLLRKGEAVQIGNVIFQLEDLSSSPVVRSTVV